MNLFLCIFFFISSDSERFHEGLFRNEVSVIKDEPRKQSVLDDRLVALQEKVCFLQQKKCYFFISFGEILLHYVFFF